jgi:hypothetical protein
MRSKAADEDGAEVDAGAMSGGGATTADTGTRNSLSASGDGTSSVTTARDPGREAQNFTDMGASAPATETQVSVPGNIGFGKTGQQPDSVGDHPAEGTGAPVRGASGGGEDESELPRPDDAHQTKGAESVGVAK